MPRPKQLVCDQVGWLAWVFDQTDQRTTEMTEPNPTNKSVIYVYAYFAKQVTGEVNINRSRTGLQLAYDQVFRPLRDRCIQVCDWICNQVFDWKE